MSNIRPAATIILVTDEKELLTCFGVNYAIQTFYVKDINTAKTNYQRVCQDALLQFGGDASSTLVFFDKKFRELV